MIIWTLRTFWWQPSFSYCISTAISNAILIISRSCFLCSRSSTVWEMARRKRWCTPSARHSSSASYPLCPQVYWKRLDIWWSHREHGNQWRDSASLFSSLHRVRKYFSISQVCSCSIYGWRGKYTVMSMHKPDSLAASAPAMPHTLFLRR